MATDMPFWLINPTETSVTFLISSQLCRTLQSGAIIVKYMLMLLFCLHLEADKQYLLSMKHREERTWVQAYLDQEKHVLRHMQGK